LLKNKQMKKSLFGLLTMLFALAGLESFAQDWVKIAEKTVNFKAEKDVVTPQGSERKVDKIRIKCIQGTVKLKKVTVVMSDGTRKEFDAKGVGVLTKGLTSLSWDLPGNPDEVKLKSVELEYDSVGIVIVSNKAKVELQGRSVKD
jgi:hypothetical protein